MTPSKSSSIPTSDLTFSDLGLPEPLLKSLSELGYETPSPIQAESIPHLLEGKDLLGQAQTGTGKTAAFVLPLLDRLVRAHGLKKNTQHKKKTRRVVRALVVVLLRVNALLRVFDVLGQLLLLLLRLLVGALGVLQLFLRVGEDVMELQLFLEARCVA